MRNLGPSIKYVMLFLTNFDPLVILCHTSRDPQKYFTRLGPLIFSGPSTKTRTKTPCTKSLNCSWGICQEIFCLEGFVRGAFCPFDPPSFRIHLLQQKVEHHFKFHVHMYDKKFISVTSHALDPPPPAHTDLANSRLYPNTRIWNSMEKYTWLSPKNNHEY